MPTSLPDQWATSPARLRVAKKRRPSHHIPLVELLGWGFAGPPSLVGFMPQPGTWADPVLKIEVFRCPSMLRVMTHWIIVHPNPMASWHAALKGIWRLQSWALEHWADPSIPSWGGRSTPLPAPTEEGRHPGLDVFICLCLAKRWRKSHVRRPKASCAQGLHSLAFLQAQTSTRQCMLATTSQKTCMLTKIASLMSENIPEPLQSKPAMSLETVRSTPMRRWTTFWASRWCLRRRQLREELDRWCYLCRHAWLQDNVNDAPTPTPEAVTKDVGKSEGDEKVPYLLFVKEVPTG